MKKISISLLLSAFIASGVLAQDFKMPAPSPSTSINQDFSTSKIELSYSRPSAKGRKIFGDLVPYGKEWRTGANSATTVNFGEEVSFGGTKVPAGKYSLYTVPGKSEWQIILNSSLENWGLSGYDKSKNVATITVKSSKLKKNVETFTISIDNMTKNSCDITLSWEKTSVTIPVYADNDARIENYLNNALKGEKPPYMSAARYYYEKGKNLDLALSYTDKAIEENPKAFYIHWMKAQILDKMGKKDAAIAAAKLAVEGAKGSPYEAEYQNNLNSLLKK